MKTQRKYLLDGDSSVRECDDSCEIGFYVMLMHTCESSWCLTLRHVMSKQFHLTISF